MRSASGGRPPPDKGCLVSVRRHRRTCLAALAVLVTFTSSAVPSAAGVRPRGGRSGAVSARLHGVALAHPSGPYVQPAPAPRPPPPAGPPFWLYVIFGALIFGLAAVVALAHRHFRSVVPVLDPVPDDTPDPAVDPGPPSEASGQTPRAVAEQPHHAGQRRRTG